MAGKIDGMPVAVAMRYADGVLRDVTHHDVSRVDVGDIRNRPDGGEGFVSIKLYGETGPRMIAFCEPEAALALGRLLVRLFPELLERKPEAGK